MGPRKRLTESSHSLQLASPFCLLASFLMNSQKAQGYTGNYIKVVFYLFLQVLDNGTILGQMKVHCQNISYQLRSWWGGGGEREAKEKEGSKERKGRRGEIRREETTVTSCKIHVKSVLRCLLYTISYMYIYT